MFTIFPKDLVKAPRALADRYFNVRHWRECDAGGHFAAWERPEGDVDDVRVAIRLASDRGA